MSPSVLCDLPMPFLLMSDDCRTCNRAIAQSGIIDGVAIRLGTAKDKDDSVCDGWNATDVSGTGADSFDVQGLSVLLDMLNAAASVRRQPNTRAEEVRDWTTSSPFHAPSR